MVDYLDNIHSYSRFVVPTENSMEPAGKKRMEGEGDESGAAKKKKKKAEATELAEKLKEKSTQKKKSSGMDLVL